MTSYCRSPLRRRLAAAIVTNATLLALPAAAAVAAPSAAPQPRAVGPVRGNGSQPDLGLGIRLLDAPVNRRDDPRAHIEIDDFVHPGTTLIRHVLVSDITPNPMHLSVYAAPAAITDEQFVIAPEGRTSELTSWMRVTPSVLNLAPETSAKVTVTISVPSTASAGERYGAVVAELGAAQPKPGQVTEASRVGTRIYLSVGDGGEPASDFRISTLTPERLANGTPAVSAQVTNTGGRALDLSGTLSLSHGPGGLRAGPFGVPQIPTLGIDQRGNVLVPLNKQTPRGPWLARLQLQSGYVKHAVTGRIVFPAHAGTVGKPVTAHPVPLLQDRHVLLPFALLLILLVAALLFFLLWHRRRKDDDEQPAAAGPRIPGPRAAAEGREAASSRRR